MQNSYDMSMIFQDAVEYGKASFDKTSQTVSNFVPFSPKLNFSRHAHKYLLKLTDISNSLINAEFQDGIIEYIFQVLVSLPGKPVF